MDKSFAYYNLKDVLKRAWNRQRLSKSESLFLLGLSQEKDLKRLFETARDLRSRYFGKQVFLYGFVYFSTWCRNDCAFCYYRKSNTVTQRYRKTDEEILEAACRLADAGVHLIDLTMGEDPVYHLKHNGFAPVINLVREIKTQTKLPVMISPGVVNEQTLRALAAAGADWYACYQETHNRQLFSQIRLNQSYDLRWLSKKLALQNGLLIEEGILAGIGETPAELVNSLENMRNLGAQQIRVMSFVPQKGIAMEDWPTPPRIRELKIIAVMRLLFPDRLIPASLDVDGVEGLEARMNAGANVITSLIPPHSGLAGVAQSCKDINEGYRTPQGILPLLQQMDLEPGTAQDYLNWLITKRHQVSANLQKTGG